MSENVQEGIFRTSLKFRNASPKLTKQVVDGRWVVVGQNPSSPPTTQPHLPPRHLMQDVTHSRRIRSLLFTTTSVGLITVVATGLCFAGRDLFNGSSDVAPALHAGGYSTPTDEVSRLEASRSGAHRPVNADRAGPIPDNGSRRTDAGISLHKDAIRCLRLKSYGLDLSSCPEEALLYSPDSVLGLLKQAASQGDINAMLSYGDVIVIKFGGFSSLVANREQASPLLRTNLELLHRAVALGSDSALMALFDSHQRGLYPDPDHVKAAAYLRALSIRNPGFPSARTEADRMLAAMPEVHRRSAESLAVEILAAP